MNEEKIARLFDKYAKKAYIHEGVLLVENGDGSERFIKTHQGKTTDSPIVTASVTKLFTAACIRILEEKGTLSLEETLETYYDMEMLKGLHMHKGKDYTASITISDLLYQTSGLPDMYEEGKNALRHKGIEEDFFFDLDEKIRLTKELPAHFIPHGERAFYSDINFDLLGGILEKAVGKPLAEIYRTYICEPLGLTHTFLPLGDETDLPVIRSGNLALNRPAFLSSCGASGGLISTTEEMMIFLKAFFQGKLFKKDWVRQSDQAYPLQFSMFPIQYRGGFMSIPLGGFATSFMGKGVLMGHSGSTGAFAFYWPHKDLFFAGDLNQMEAASLTVRFPMQLAMTLS